VAREGTFVAGSELVVSRFNALAKDIERKGLKFPLNF